MQAESPVARVQLTIQLEEETVRPPEEVLRQNQKTWIPTPAPSRSGSVS